MLRSDPDQGGAGGGRRPRFVLYVEGPRDREILARWAHLLSPVLAQALQDVSVILGGRQPGRALDHYRGVRGRGRRVSALCILDRDEGRDPLSRFASPPAGLEFLTWRRRHIESYLLVPEAIRRALGAGGHDQRTDRALRAHLPRRSEDELREIDAKRLLHERGPLARDLGRPLAPGRIARAMRRDDLHPEVIDALERIRRGVGLDDPAAADPAR